MFIVNIIVINGTYGGRREVSIIYYLNLIQNYFYELIGVMNR